MYRHKSFTMVTKFTKFAKVFQCVTLPIYGIAGLFALKLYCCCCNIQLQWTPLHYAAFNGYAEIAEVLVKNKASISMKDNVS